LHLTQHKPNNLKITTHTTQSRNISDFHFKQHKSEQFTQSLSHNIVQNIMFKYPLITCHKPDQILNEQIFIAVDTILRYTILMHQQQNCPCWFPL